MSHKAATPRERFAYYAVRVGLGAAGLLVILATLSIHLIEPVMFFDKAPGPPPLRDRLPEIIVTIGIGLLMCVPHRWTRPPTVFWIRIAATIALAGFLFWRAGGDVIHVMRGGSPGDLLRAVLFVGVAIAVPLSLWWSRRISLVT
jgi:hypothetical protein